MDRKSKRLLLGFILLVLPLTASAFIGGIERPSVAPERFGVFQEALVPFEAPTESQSRELQDVVSAYRASGDPADITPLERYLDKTPQSPWRASLLLNMGLAREQAGYYSEAIRLLERARLAGDEADRQAEEKVASRALGELLSLHARFGHPEELAQLLNAVQGSPANGTVSERIAQAESALWEMQNRPEEVLRCGIVALEALLDVERGGAPDAPTLDRVTAGSNGVSLGRLEALANQNGLAAQAAQRRAEASIPVPSVMHLRVGHYATLLQESDGRYKVLDPAYGQTRWLSRAAVVAESSGYFLVPERVLETASWQPVSNETAEEVIGAGNTSSSQADQTTIDDIAECDPNCSESTGMPRYRVHSMLVSLNIVDSPVGYAPPVGPEVPVTLSYIQRAAHQPATYTFGNLGPKWTLNWLSYVQDDPQQAGRQVRLYLPGGGSRAYTGYTSSGAFRPEQRTGAQLVRSSSTPVRYERKMPDGRRYVYAESDGSSYYPRRIFLTEVIDAAGNTLTLQYDHQLRLNRLTDALGQVTRIHYGDPSDPLLITGVTDPFGRTADFGYDDSGRLDRITDALGMTSSFTYDSGTFITAMQTPYGTTTFDAGQNGTTRWITITDPNGDKERVEFRHSASGIPFSDSPLPSGMRLFNRYINSRNTFYWDKEAMKRAPGDYTQARIRHWYHLRTNTSSTTGVQESIKAPLERRIWFNYPGQSWEGAEGTLDKPSIIGRVLPDGSSQLIHKSYNAIGNLTRLIDPAGREVRFEYADNQIDVTRILRKSSSGFDVLATYTYSEQHRPLTYTDPAGQVYRYTYNAAGQLLNTVNPLGQVTTYDYDASGYLLGIVDPNGVLQAKYTYDDMGRIATQTNAAGYTREYQYDALDRLTEVRYPDGTKERISWLNLDVGSTEDRYGNVTQYDYDAARNLLETVDPSGHTTGFSHFGNGALATLADGHGYITRFERDIQSRLTETVRADGRRSRVRYDVAGRAIQRIDAMEGITSLDYGIDGRLTGVTDPNGQTTYYQYDRYTGQLADQDSPDSGSTSYMYDVSGNLVSQTDARGQVMRSTYDALNRVMHTEYSDGQVLDYRYDTAANGAGRLAEVRDISGTTEFAYDLQGHITRRTRTDRNGVELSVDYTYTPAGLLSRVTYPSGAVVDYDYDRDRLSGIRVNGQPLIDQISYAPFGPITGWLWGNGEASNLSYDAVGRLETFDIVNGTRQLEYDEVGNIIGLGGSLIQQSFTYDALDRLTEAQSSDFDPTNSFSLEYVYDANGNRMQDGNDGMQRLYTLDGDSNRFSRVGDQPYTYDANGNLISDGRHSYQYDGRNRLVSVDGGDTGRYEYNAFGQRVYKYGRRSYRLTPDLNGDGIVDAGDLHALKDYVRNSESPMQADLNQDGKVDMRDNACIATQIGNSKDDPVPQDCRIGEWVVVTTESHFVYDDFRLLGEYTPDGLAFQEIIWLGERPVGLLQDGQLYAVHTNQIGAPLAVTDMNGTVVWRWEPRPFGDNLPDEDPDGNGQLLVLNLRFPGQYFDAETGLYYNYFRDYDPATGRYIESDPIGLEGGLNTYVYVFSNPLAYMDPFGLEGGFFQGVDKSILRRTTPWIPKSIFGKAMMDVPRMAGQWWADNPDLYNGMQACLEVASIPKKIIALILDLKTGGEVVQGVYNGDYSGAAKKSTALFVGKYAGYFTKQMNVDNEMLQSGTGLAADKATKYFLYKDDLNGHGNE
ncbi:MAG: RHS repeat protein [Oceanospirillaceae bacterium]|nr:RHS repeat protein [Oceanospirillaceae bacterium]